MATPGPFSPTHNRRHLLKSEMERFAELAASAFREEKYDEARDLYTEAIKHGHKSSDIALLLGNRASCHRKLVNNDSGLKDAQAAINKDPTYLKAYNKAGDFAMQMGSFNEALGYFRDGYLKAVEQDEDPLTFLVHISYVIPNVEDVHVEMILRPVQPVRRLRTKLVERLVAEEKWHHVHAVLYRGGGGHQPQSGGIATGCDTAKISMAPLLHCYRAYQPPLVHDIICALLKHGSGLGGFSSWNGDTPIHALLWVELMKEEGLPVMTLICTELRARFIDQLKALDAKGNTLIHVVAMSGRSCALRASKLLIDVAGLDPITKNADGKTAIHYAQGGTELSNYLRNRREEARGASKRVSKPPATETSPSGQRTSKAKAKNTEAPMRAEHRLEIFARTISEAKLQDVGDMTEDHQRCLEGIVNVIDTPKVEVVPTTVVVEAPPSVWRHTVEKLSSQKKWRTLGMLLTGGGNYYNTGDGGLATGCDTTCVPLMQVLNFFETRMAKQSRLKVRSVMRELLKGGTSPDGDASDNHPIGHCLRKKDFVSVQMLLEHGAKFSRLTRKEGDALLWAAVQMANEGNMEILNLLLDEKEINHQVADSSENNLLHIAVKERNSKESTELIKRLLDIGVDSSVTNKKGMTPLDYLKQDDSRRQILEPHMKKEEEITNKNGIHTNSKPSSEGTDQIDLTSVHGAKMPDSLQGKGAIVIVETEVLGRGPDHKDHKGPNSIHSDKTLDSSEAKRRVIISKTEGPGRERGQKPQSRAQEETTKEDIKRRIDSSILNIPLPVGEETEERLLRLVKQKTKPMANTIPDKEQVNLEDEKVEKTEAGRPLSPIAQGGKPLSRCSGDVANEELSGISTDIFHKDNPWKVECTDKVDRIMTKDKRLPFDVKKSVVEKVNRLAQGEWTKDLTKTVRGRPHNEGMQLFEAKVNKATRILWELAIAFSPQNSMVEPMKYSAGNQEAIKSTREASGSQVYSETIRLWDIVCDHDNLKRAIEQAVISFKANPPIPKKSLIRLTECRLESNPRHPTLFTLKDVAANSRGISEEQRFTMVSSHENGHNIPKFYNFNSSLVNASLREIAVPVEFPFKVNESEYAIVHLRANPPSSILLLGRSGTGKTTCCLYRLWNAFLAYWTGTESAASGFKPWGYITHVSAGVDDDESTEESTEESKTVRAHKEASKSNEQTSIKIKEEANVEESSGQRHDYAKINLDSNTKKTDDKDESLHARMLKRQGKESETGKNPEATKEQFEHLHQIFVTKNAILCSEVRDQFRRFCNAEKSACEYLKAIQHENNIPGRLQDVDPAGFPLFLDSRQWLLMLDASLGGTSFFKRTSYGHMTEEVPGWMKNNGDAGLVLEATTDLEVDEKAGKRQHKRRTMRQVTYEVFYTELWERVNREKEDYHPTLVWMEIVSIIKGSVEAVETNRGFLSREEYLEIGKKRAEFTGDRDKIYDIFQTYQHEKRQRHMFDEMDFVHNLYKRLAHAEDVDWSIHQVYVDETQDFTQAELALLIRCCRDPNEMFFTGDTAQSIMRGVSFRFKDLRSLFHKARESLQQMGKRTSVQVPEMYHLTDNYRSHCGILNLAAGVIDLLGIFFPYSFDILPKDKGINEGPKPLLLRDCSREDLATLLKGHERIEFGANQVVIVANNNAKKSMPDVFRGSLVLTIYESKGLEFDDVLLYNIFKDSQANEEWRVVLKWKEEKDKKGLSVKSKRPLPVDNSDKSSPVVHARPLDFNPDMHKVLNSELKNLYTAITRARVNVWIFDEDTAKHAPMFKYFLDRRLVDMVDKPQRDRNVQGQPSANVFARKSTPEEWCGRGEYFYKKERWEIASNYFKKGGNQRRANMATAHHLAHQASQGTAATREKHKMFLKSAALFLQSGNHVDGREALVSAAICLRNSGEFHLAAKLFERLGKVSSAADMYKEANKATEASRCFLQIGNFKEAVNSLTSVKRFEDAADLAKQYIDLETRCRKEGLDPTIVMTAPVQTLDSLLLAATRQYHRQGEVEKMVSCLKRLPMDIRVTFLKKPSSVRDTEKHGRVNEIAALLKKEGMRQEAAELLKSVGEYEEAAKAADQHNNPQFVADCLLFQSRRQRKYATTDIQGTKGNLIRCKDLYNRCGNNEGGAEAMMMLGDLTGDASMLHDVIMLYGINVPAGATEAAIVLIGKKAVLSFDKIRLILSVLECLFRLIRTLLLAREHSEKEHQWVKACELFYGVEHYSEAIHATFSPSEEPRILDVLSREFSGRAVSTTKMTIHGARVCMARDLIRKAEQLREKLSLMLQSIATRSRVCHMYTAGLICPKGDACAYLHHPYDKDTLNSLLQATVLHIKVYGIFDLGYEKIKDCESERVQQAVASHKDRGAEKSRLCDDLYCILFPTHGHQRLLTQNFLTARDVYHKFQGDAIVMSCIRDYAKSLWESASHSDKRSNTDLLIKIANLFRLAKDSPVTFSRLLASAEEEYKKWAMTRKRPDKTPVHVGMICVDGGSNICLFFSFMRRLEEFIQNIYKREDMLSSLDNMKAFMGFLAMRAKEPLIPSFANTCFFMELLTVICYSIYAKMNQHELLCLPASYISMVHLCDRLWSGGKGSIFSAIERLPGKKDEILVKVNNCIWFIINIICQSQQYPNFNLIDDVFRPNIPVESGEMERVFILAVVLICGCGGPVPKKAEIPLREALYRVNIKRHFPQRLANAIRGMRTAKGIRDIVILLQDLLKARDQEYLRHCCWKYPDRMTRGVYRGLNFEQVKPDLFIRGFWRNIMFLPGRHDDDFETQADNSASTNGQNDACERSSDDVLIPEGSAGIVETEASHAEDEVKAYQGNNDFIAEGELEEKEKEELVDDEMLGTDDLILAKGMYERISQQQAEERRQTAAYKIQTFWRAHRKINSTETQPRDGRVTGNL